MRRIFCTIALFLFTTLSNADSPVKVTEYWEAVYARDQKKVEQLIGFSRTTLEPVEVDGKEVIRATRELNIRIKREGQTAPLRLSEGTEASADGKTTGVFLTAYNGEQAVWKIKGKVKGKKLLVRQEGIQDSEREVDWDPSITSLNKELTLVGDKKAKPGDEFDYRTYASTLGQSLKVHVRVEAEEEVATPLKKDKRKLLRVELEPEEIQGIQLPGNTTWFDPKSYELVMTQTEMPGFGVLTLVRTTKEVATGPLGNLPDMIDLLSIRLDETSGDMHSMSRAVYRVTTLTNANPEKIIKADERQTIKNVDRKKRTFEIHVEAKRTPVDIAEPKPVDEQYLKSNHFITSDDELVQKLAKEAVGNETDPWKQAQHIEKFVRGYITEGTYTQALDTAAQVAKSRKGDCTEFSMLSAAMCRAAGVPSRTAVGLVYVERTRLSETPILAFHMWTEVYVKGQWLGLDATMAKGSIGPGHIKISDHSWHEVKSFLPLLPVQGFVQTQPAVKVISTAK
jgi:hypothetical protein